MISGVFAASKDNVLTQEKRLFPATRRKEKKRRRSCRFCLKKKKKRAAVDIKMGLISCCDLHYTRAALNNDDKRSPRQAPPRELLPQYLGLIALRVLPAGARTHAWRSVRTEQPRTQLRSALKDINKGELAWFMALMCTAEKRSGLCGVSAWRRTDMTNLHCLGLFCF